MRRRYGIPLVVLALLAVAGCVSVRMFENASIFIPDRELLTDPGELDLEFEDLRVPVGKNDELHGWWVHSMRDPRRGVVLFFHGNAGNISHRLQTIQFWTDAGFDIVIFDYRGYGKSTGRPNERHAYEDGLAMWRYLTETKSIPPGQIVVQGRSLGGGISSWLVADHTPGVYILESSFKSMPELVKELIPWIPRWIVQTQMDTIHRIGQVKCPVLIAHGRDDEVIGFHHGQELYEVAPEPKHFIELDGGHNGAWAQTPNYGQEVDDFLTGVARFDP